jgi:MoxR-like ATPase
MFNVMLDYPHYAEEVQIVKETTSNRLIHLDTLMHAEDIVSYQKLIRKIPVNDNVVEYAVGLVAKTRPNTDLASEKVKEYIAWGAGPRASQFMLLGSKCHAAINGKYSPDIEDVKAVAKPILRHRIVKNYKAEAEGISVDTIIESIL